MQDLQERERIGVMSRVCIIDYGSGNQASVYNIFRSLTENVSISKDPAELDAATHIVLPGVGAFGAVMEKLSESGVIDSMTENVLGRKKPFLGICVGMQILAGKGTEHGECAGLGWIKGTVRKMDEKGGLRLPHIGWNNFERMSPCAVLDGIAPDVDYYFVNSYYFDAEDAGSVAATYMYGKEYTAAVMRDNIFGVQFHPEKSQKAGKMLLENFLNI